MGAPGFWLRESEWERREREAYGYYDTEGSDMSNYDGYGYDDDDEYDSDEDGYDSGDESTGTPAREDDETASAAGSLRKVRIRNSDYCRLPEFTHQDRQSFFNSLQSNFNMPDLKDVLAALHLPKSGKKIDLVNRLADHMAILLGAKNMKDLNAVIALLNPRVKSTWAARPFAMYPEPDLIAEFLAKSKLYRFNIELPAGNKIEKYVSDPLYIPLAPREVAKQMVLEFNHTGPPWNYAQSRTAKRLAVLVLRIHDIKENPAEGSVKYRLSYGSRIEGMLLNGLRVFRAFENDEAFPFFPLQNSLVTGRNTISIICEYKAPYYIQVVEMTHDPTVVPVIPAEKVKKAFLDRSRQSDVQASSLQLSLRCPLSLVRIKTPVRFDTCKHLQCMELDAWTSYSSTAGNHYGRAIVKPCPICNSSASKALVIDGYFKEILGGTNEDVDMVTVDVENELRWSLNLASSSKDSISLHPETQAAASSSPVAPLDEPVEVDLTEDNTVYDTPWVQPVRVKPEPALPDQHLSIIPQTRPPPPAVDDDVVDLTRDSPVRPGRMPETRDGPRPFIPNPQPEFEIIEID